MDDRELGREGGRGGRVKVISTSTGDSERRDDRLLIPSKIVPSLLRREEKWDRLGEEIRVIVVGRRHRLFELFLGILLVERKVQIGRMLWLNSDLRMNLAIRSRLELFVRRG